MIPESNVSVIKSLEKEPNWKLALAQATLTPTALLQALELDHNIDLLKQAQQANQGFPLKVTQSYISRMRKGDINDPLLRQVLPLGDENQLLPDFISDPVGDLEAMVVPGLLHKYHGRALLVTTGACAIHCRYCFRREFPYQEANPTKDQWQTALQYLENHPDISEIILSGGDPLVLSDRRLLEIFNKLNAISHIKRIRIHTRLPIVLPERITTTLLQAIHSIKLKVVIVVHSNHANEINNDVKSALLALHEQGLTLLNQAVLLKGINDSASAQAKLSEVLFEAGVIPYYLHMLDKVKGAAHFEVDKKKALEIMHSLRQQLPGYLVPKLVQEIPGEKAKTPVL